MYRSLVLAWGEGVLVIVGVGVGGISQRLRPRGEGGKSGRIVATIAGRHAGELAGGGDGDVLGGHAGLWQGAPNRTSRGDAALLEVGVPLDDGPSSPAQLGHDVGGGRAVAEEHATEGVVGEGAAVVQVDGDAT